MKSVELRRHSRKVSDGNVGLSEGGIAFAESVGATMLKGRHFTHLFVSSLPRTVDTLRAFSDGAGDFPRVKPRVFFEHFDVFATDEGLRLWQGVCHEAERKGEDMMMAALKEDAQSAEHVAALAATTFREWIELLPQDANALVVHHSPSIELLAYGLFGVVIPQLQPCEGVRIVAEDNLQLLTLENDSSLGV